MSDCKHTPGPWKWHWRSEGKIATGSVYAEPREGHAYAIAMTPRFQTKKQWDADARLIAAAPDLLDVLLDIWAGYADKLDSSLAQRTSDVIAKALRGTP